MSKLNQPRTIPYSFKVFEYEGIVWLYDDSSRTYICSAQPSIWAEPCYWIDGECDERLPEPDYFDSGIPGKCPSANLRADREEYRWDVSESEAWDCAREEAHANHLL